MGGAGAAGPAANHLFGGDLHSSLDDSLYSDTYRCEWRVCVLVLGRGGEGRGGEGTRWRGCFGQGPKHGGGALVAEGHSSRQLMPGAGQL